MSNPYVSRLRKHFPTYVYPNIASCLKEFHGVGATILICCAIDTLAAYASASPHIKGNKQNFLSFVRNYFPSDYDSEKFYKFVRCGLVHSFNMENEYMILCGKQTWAQDLHFKRPTGFPRTIINPFTLFRHLKGAHKRFIDDLLCNPGLRRDFSRVYKAKPILKQHIRIPKAFKKLQKP